MMTPEPDGGFYTEHEAAAFILKFGRPNTKGKHDRWDFSGRHFFEKNCAATGLRMELAGFDGATGMITDANGKIALVSADGDVAASWSFKKILEHWSHKHAKAVYVPSKRQTDPKWQYAYGHKVRLAERTDALRLLRAFAVGSMYYDPSTKLEEASSPKPRHKKRSQFRVASKRITTLYETVELVEL